MSVYFKLKLILQFCPLKVALLELSDSNFKESMFNFNNRKQDFSHSETFITEEDILVMAREILSVIQKRYPAEQTSLKEFTCDGEVAKCTYAINDKPIFNIK